MRLHPGRVVPILSTVLVVVKSQLSRPDRHRRQNQTYRQARRRQSSSRATRRLPTRMMTRR